MIHEPVQQHVDALIREADEELLNHIRMRAREEFIKRGGEVIWFGLKEPVQR